MDNVVAIKKWYWLSRRLEESESRVRGLRVGKLVRMVARRPGLFD